MTAKLLESKKTQGERVLEYIRNHPWCSNVDIIAGTRVGSPWKRIAEYVTPDYLVRSTMRWGGPNDLHWHATEHLRRRYVDHNGRKIVQYKVVKV